MSWLEPAGWLFSLIVPVIIAMYLLKRQYENHTIASTLLWLQALKDQEAIRPWQKLKRNLLLLMQLLVALALVLALARPALLTSGLAAKHTVLVIDTSATMATRDDGEKSRLEKAHRHAESLVESLGPGQTVTLVEMRANPRVVASTSTSRQELKQALSTLTLSYGLPDVKGTLSLARSLAGSQGAGQVVLISDGAWAREQEGLPTVDRHIRIGDASANVTLAAFAVEKAESHWNALVRIDNHGKQEVSGYLHLKDEQGNLLDIREVRIASQGRQEVKWDAIRESRAWEARLEVPGDPLVEDNVAWATPLKAERPKVGLMTVGNRFMEQALALGNRVDVTKLALNDPVTPNVFYDLMVFDGVIHVGWKAPNWLVLDPPRGIIAPKPPVPGGMGGPKPAQAAPGDAKEHTVLKDVPRVLEPNHPLLRHVNFEEVHISRASATPAPPWAQVLAQAGEHPLVWVGEEGSRRIVGLNFDLHDSDLPLRPGFPVFVQNTLDWLLPQAQKALPTGIPGETMKLPLTGGNVVSVIVHPDQQAEVMQTNSPVLTYQAPPEIGLYHLEEEITGSGARILRPFVIQYPRAASFIQPVSLSTGQGMEQNLTGTEGLWELWPWLAVGALVLAGLEWMVYCRGY